MITDREIIRNAHRDAPKNAREWGEEITLTFTSDDVAGLHTHKEGRGDGVWFRLHDGRVLDGFGEEDDTDPSLYDTVPN